MDMSEYNNYQDIISNMYVNLFTLHSYVTK